MQYESYNFTHSITVFVCHLGKIYRAEENLKRGNVTERDFHKNSKHRNIMMYRISPRKRAVTVPRLKFSPGFTNKF